MPARPSEAHVAPSFHAADSAFAVDRKGCDITDVQPTIGARAPNAEVQEMV